MTKLRVPYKENKALYFCIFMLFLLSMNLWIGWDGRAKYFYHALSLALFIIIGRSDVRLNWSWRNVVPLLCLIAGWTYIQEEVGLGLGIFTHAYLPYAIIILLNDKDKVLCLKFIVKWFAWLMVPCIITYALVQTVGIPSLGKIWVNHTLFYKTSYVLRDNYLFYMYSAFYGIRFNGPFVEAGHLGMMSAFLLFADGFDLQKKETWIIILSLLLTLSLSGYVLVVIAYLFTMYSRNKIGVQYVLLFIFTVLGFYLFGVFYNGGDNIINEMILSRLEYDEERGFTGNNRAFGQIPLYFAMMWNDTNTMLFGYGRETMKWLAETGSRGTGFTMWMVSHGVIGTIAAMLFYLVYSLFSKNKLFAFLLFAFVCMVFWQRSYPFWFSWVICYAYGITYNRKISRRLR